MNTRVWKTGFTAIFGLLALSYAVQNVANLTGGMYGSFAYVLGQADHVAYPRSAVPAITQPGLIWAALTVVLLLEFICAALALLGAWTMWQHRHESRDAFRLAKRHALNGFGVGVVVWLFLFGTLGAAVFQMWQTDIGAASYNGAFQFAVYGLLLFGLVSLDD
jgi:predicted small integral membrane protein